MSDLKLPSEEKKKDVSLVRVGIWLFAGGVGLYMIVSGLLGVISHG